MHSNKITEQQNPNTMNIDQKSVVEILETINNEDANIHSAVKKAIPQIEIFVNSVVDTFWKSGRLFYVGAGTSGRLGVLDASECPPTYRTDPNMVQGIIAGGKEALVKSIEGAEDNPEEGKKMIRDMQVSEKDVVLGISAAGTAPYVLGALEEAKFHNAATGLLICNEMEKPKFIDHLIKVIVGPEVVTGSTRMKAGTATKLVLNMITTTAMIKLNKTYGNVMVDLNACNEKLWDRGTRIIMHFTELDYNQSLKLLKSANGEVKTALVMETLKQNYENAKLKLNQNNGSISSIIS